MDRYRPGTRGTTLVRNDATKPTDAGEANPMNHGPPYTVPPPVGKPVLGHGDGNPGVERTVAATGEAGVPVPSLR